MNKEVKQEMGMKSSRRDWLRRLEWYRRNGIGNDEKVFEWRLEDWLEVKMVQDIRERAVIADSRMQQPRWRRTSWTECPIAAGATSTQDDNAILGERNK